MEVCFKNSLQVLSGAYTRFELLVGNKVSVIIVLMVIIKRYNYNSMTKKLFECYFIPVQKAFGNLIL